MELNADGGRAAQCTQVAPAQILDHLPSAFVQKHIRHVLRRSAVTQRHDRKDAVTEPGIVDLVIMANVQRGQPVHQGIHGNIRPGCIADRLRALAEYRGREPFVDGFPGLGKQIAPDHRPRQAGQDNRHGPHTEPRAGHGMQLTPEAPPFGAQFRECGATFPVSSRPPQVKTGDHQNQRPAGDPFDQDLARRTQHQAAMDALGQIHQPPVFINGAADLGALRMQKHGPFRPGIAGQHHLRRFAGVARWLIAVNLLGAKPLTGRRDQGVVVDRPCIRLFQVEPVAVHPVFNLRLQQIHAAGDCHDEQHRKNDQPGIEMPTPDRTIGFQVSRHKIS